MYSIMNRLYKSLKSSQSNKLGEGPFFGPCLWDLQKHKNHRPSNVRVFVTNLMLCSNLFIHSIMSRLHKPLKRSLQSPNPQGLIFGSWLLGPWKHENHRPSNVRVFVTNLMFFIKFIHVFYYE
jgi:hypothetical protein